jgi:probable blue pigment (indigoidine) exporter
MAWPAAVLPCFISRFLYRPLSVYRLPGGVAATVGAVQPLMVVFISAALLGSPIRLMAVLGAICGTAGVALLVLTPNAALDPVGVAAGLAGAVSMAFGTVLTRKWQPPVPLLTFTAWQLAAGGLLLVPVALVFDPPIPMPTGTNVLGLAWLGLIGAGLTYFLWFRGISRLEPTVVSLLGFQPGDRRVARMVVLGSDAECASNHRRPARDREYLAGPTFQPHS